MQTNMHHNLFKMYKMLAEHQANNQKYQKGQFHLLSESNTAQYLAWIWKEI
jgi:hypothetical protein